MKREKFLWPMTHAHHFGLMAAKTIQKKLSEKPGRQELNKIREKAKKFFRSDLAAHIGVEEEMLSQLAFHTSSDDPLLAKARQEHQELAVLLEKRTTRSLELFAEKLIRHIYFEEDRLFPRIEDQFTQAEKEWVETEVQFKVRDWPLIKALPAK